MVLAVDNTHLDPDPLKRLGKTVDLTQETIDYAHAASRLRDDDRQVGTSRSRSRDNRTHSESKSRSSRNGNEFDRDLNDILSAGPKKKGADSLGLLKGAYSSPENSPSPPRNRPSPMRRLKNKSPPPKNLPFAKSYVERDLERELDKKGIARTKRSSRSRSKGRRPRSPYVKGRPASPFIPRRSRSNARRSRSPYVKGRPASPFVPRKRLRRSLSKRGTLSTFLNNGRVQRALQQNPHYVILMFTGNDIDTIYRLHGLVPWQPHPECWDMSCHLDHVLGRVGVECSCPRQRHITEYASPSQWPPQRLQNGYYPPSYLPGELTKLIVFQRNTIRQVHPFIREVFVCSLLPQHEELYRHYPNLASHHVPNYNAIADICNYALMKREAWFIQLDMSCCPFHDPAKIEAFGLMPSTRPRAMMVCIMTPTRGTDKYLDV